MNFSLLRPWIDKKDLWILNYPKKFGGIGTGFGEIDSILRPLYGRDGEPIFLGPDVL
jgi:hypothetical protein